LTGVTLCASLRLSHSYKGKTFTVKPMEHVKSVKEINVKDYMTNMTNALEQTFAPVGIKPEQKLEKKISVVRKTNS
jgi:hypothetical protein